MPHFLRTTLALALVSLPAIGAQTAPSACPLPESHQFDFWIGDWEVRDMGAMSGHNSIKPILDGCVLQETWSGVSGSAGTSLNFYDTERKLWRQFWVWREGTTLELDGEFHDGKMRLEGASVSPKGEKLRNRITWSRNSDETVRQLWEVSRDEGATWKTQFDGEYRRMLEKPKSR
jgi:hypothetical protein